jgi:hypothetical protein
MPVPTTATYAVAALEAAHQSLVDLIDTDSPGSLTLFDADDVEIASFEFDVPCGTVSPTTGTLTFAMVETSAVVATAATVAYGAIADEAGTAYLSLPAAVGTAAASGYVVLNALEVAEGGTLTVMSVSVG